MSDQRLDAIEERLTRLERRVEAHAWQAKTPASAQPAPRILQTPRVAPEPLPMSSLAPSSIDAESFLGGRVLLATGAFVLLLGVGFFIKYAFDNGWVGPIGRVAIGLIGGITFVAGGEYFQRAKQRIYAGALTGLGGGILYLSLWAAGNGFHLVPIAASFSAMAVVTGALIALSVFHDSEMTAGFALSGGFITPLLNATATPHPLQLLAYIGILDAALAFVPINRRWPRIQGTAFVFTQIYALTAYFAMPPLPILTFLSFATLYLALFVWQPIHKTLRSVALDAYEVALLVLSAGAYYAALHAELFESHRGWLTATVVVLAAIYVTLARLAKDSTGRAAFAAIGLALVTGGVAITFTGDVVAVLWAVEGALLGGLGIRGRLAVVQFFGFAAFALGILHLIALPPVGGAPFVNERFLTLAVFAAAFFVVHALSVSRPGGKPSPIYLAYQPIGHVFAVVGVSYELYDWTHANQLSLTLFWLAYALVLFAAGLLRRSSSARWEAFALLALAIGKAFLIDMSELNPGIRIVSFLALGSVMLAISYAYQRYTAKGIGTQP